MAQTPNSGDAALGLAQRALETPRLWLRPLAEGDVSAMWSVNSDPQVTRFLPYTAWTCSDDAQAWYQRMEGRIQRGEITYNVMVDKSTGAVVGGTLLMNWDPQVRKLEVGYAMARSHQGRGLMQEAVRAEIDDAFLRWDLRRLEAHIDARNQASRVLVERLGFRCEAVLRDAWCDNAGALTDATIYGLLRREWQTLAKNTS